MSEREISPRGIAVEHELPELVFHEQVHYREHILLWQVTGLSRMVIDDQPMTLTGGSAVWLPQRTRHAFTMARNSAMLPVFFPAHHVNVAPGGPGVVRVQGHLATVLTAVTAAYYAALLTPSANIGQIAIDLIEAQLRVPDGLPMPRSETGSRVAREVVRNPADTRTLREWAAHLHVSSRTLERTFRQETGMAWKNWRVACRMERAAALLRTEQGSIADIASLIGYSTHSAFTRAFHAHFGTSPTDYRARENPA